LFLYLKDEYLVSVQVLFSGEKYSDLTKTSTHSETDIFKILDYVIGNIFVVFGGCVLQQTVGIPMGTICALLLISSFLYSCEADFI